MISPHIYCLAHPQLYDSSFIANIHTHTHNPFDSAVDPVAIRKDWLLVTGFAALGREMKCDQRNGTCKSLTSGNVLTSEFLLFFSMTRPSLVEFRDVLINVCCAVNVFSLAAPIQPLSTVTSIHVIDDDSIAGQRDLQTNIERERGNE